MEKFLNVLYSVIFNLSKIICVPLLFFVFHILGLIYKVLNKLVNWVIKGIEYFVKDEA